jgi:hypothetical protein
MYVFLYKYDLINVSNASNFLSHYSAQRMANKKDPFFICFNSREHSLGITVKVFAVFRLDLIDILRFEFVEIHLFKNTMVISESRNKVNFH